MSARRGAIILAAGASQRMGTPKALLPWAGTTLLGYALREALASAVTDVVVVLGPATQHLAATINATTVVNPTPESGRSTSIRFGATALPDDVASVVVQSVDQPAPAEVLRALFGALTGPALVALPTYDGRRGHPVCLAGPLLAELRRLDERAEGLRSVVRGHQAHLVEVPVGSASILWNLNDPAAYEAASQAAP
jgi:CTP:molybdopterin cytidylyltransferase MocA